MSDSRIFLRKEKGNIRVAALPKIGDYGAGLAGNLQGHFQKRRYN